MKERSDMIHDVVILGGGPAGLSAALALGRARKRVALCDAGPRRNASAERIHNFVTRDGQSPSEFRAIGRQQLVTYPNVTVRDERVETISGARGAFRVGLANDTIEARRILLCTGMVDEMLAIEGFQELWGQAIFQCPYCHGWEVQDRQWGYLAQDTGSLLVPLLLRGWARDVVVFTNDSVDVEPEMRARLVQAGIRLETAPLARLVIRDHRLEAIELSDGATVPCQVLFAHPPQRQVDIVRALGVALDPGGYIQVDPMTCETSVPGIYAAGDPTSRMQAAIIAAACGARAAGALNHELTAELVTSGVV